MERGAPNSLHLMESGKLLPGVKVIIADPETKGHCGDNVLGEVSSGKLQKNLIIKDVHNFFFWQGDH